MSLRSLLVPLVSLLLASLAVPGPLWAADPAADCARYLDGARPDGVRTFGIQSCRAREPLPIARADGVAALRLEIGVTGVIDGFTPKVGPRYEMLTDVPEYALAQRDNHGPYFRGTGYYTAEKGNLVTILLPASAADWNGKMFVLVHGMSSYGKLGELVPRVAGKYTPLMDANEFAGLMLDRGFVVVHTSRPAARRGNGARETVVLRDGTKMGEKSFGYHAALIKDWTALAHRVVRDRFGRAPDRTYYYGKSAGASLGRLINYVPGLNEDARGRRLFDGFFIDDAGGGQYMPTLNFRRVVIDEHSFRVEPDAVDRLQLGDAATSRFVPQIDLVHQAYIGADFVEGNYLAMKRLNAVLLKKKGMASKARTYEVVGVSHADAGLVWPDPLYTENQDLSGIADAVIEMLDGWVEGRAVPPPSRSDDYRVGDADGDFTLDYPAIRLPEVACPLGVYYEFPPGVTEPGKTGFAAYLDTPRPPLNADTTKIPAGFREEWLEPLDGRGRPLDMNRNGVRDTRETVEEAWRRRRVEGERYGTLEVDESFTPDRYAACVIRSASDLADAGLISKPALFHYVEEAMVFREKAKAAHGQ